MTNVRFRVESENYSGKAAEGLRQMVFVRIDNRNYWADIHKQVKVYLAKISLSYKTT